MNLSRTNRILLWILCSWLLPGSLHALGQPEPSEALPRFLSRHPDMGLRLEKDHLMWKQSPISSTVTLEPAAKASLSEFAMHAPGFAEMIPGGERVLLALMLHKFLDQAGSAPGSGQQSYYFSQDPAGHEVLTILGQRKWAEYMVRRGARLVSVRPMPQDSDGPSNPPELNLSFERFEKVLGEGTNFDGAQTSKNPTSQPQGSAIQPKRGAKVRFDLHTDPLHLEHGVQPYPQKDLDQKGVLGNPDIYLGMGKIGKERMAMRYEEPGSPRVYAFAGSLQLRNRQFRSRLPNRDEMPVPNLLGIQRLGGTTLYGTFIESQTDKANRNFSGGIQLNKHWGIGGGYGIDERTTPHLLTGGEFGSFSLAYSGRGYRPKDRSSEAEVLTFGRQRQFTHSERGVENVAGNGITLAHVWDVNMNPWFGSSKPRRAKKDFYPEHLLAQVYASHSELYGGSVGFSLDLSTRLLRIARAKFRLDSNLAVSGRNGAGSRPPTLRFEISPRL